jgi:uncharacterized protein YbbC (DUF1343 family)
VGRGTDQPFELFGAPWMDGRKVSAQLNAMDLPGLRFYPIEFQPNTREFRDKPCQGVFVVITDRRIVEPVRSGLTIAWVLNKQYGPQYQIEKINNLMCSAQTLVLLKTIDDPAKLPATWKDEVRSFLKMRQKYLMYK